MSEILLGKGGAKEQNEGEKEKRREGRIGDEIFS